MSFQRVWRLRVLKFLHFGGSRNQKKILPGVQLSTKAINVKKPVRYTSIKKAKPKTIADIAKILQQKTKDREQKPEAAFSTEPATPNQYNAGIDSINNILSTSKVHTAPSTFPAKVASALVEKEPARDVSDREAVAKDAPKKSASVTGACESVAAHNLPQETDVISSYETVASDSKLAFYVTTSIPELDHSVQTYNTANTKVMATPAVLVLEVLEDVLDSTVDCHSTLTPAASEVSSSEAADESHVVDDIISPFGNETEKIVGVEDGEVHGNAPSSINLKEPAVVHTEVLEDKLRTDTVEESPVARLDPIQRLFLDKIREYSAKSKSSGGLVDAGPEYEKAFNEELAKLHRLYGGGDLTNFPEFNFSETNLDEDSSNWKKNRGV